MSLSLNKYYARINMTAEGNGQLLNDLNELGAHMNSIDPNWTYSSKWNRRINNQTIYAFRLDYNKKNALILNCASPVGIGVNTKWIENGLLIRTSLEVDSADKAGLGIVNNISSASSTDFTSDTSLVDRTQYSTKSYSKMPFSNNYSTNNRQTFMHWGIGLTGYGAMLTLPFLTPDSISSLAPSTADCFLFQMKDALEEEKETGAILMNAAAGPVNETTVDYVGSTSETSMNFLTSGEHIQLERLPTEYFTSLAYRGTVPVLTNMCSKQTSYYAPHLYIKETAHDDCFGHVKIEDTYFMAGAGFCLETTEGKGQ